MTDNVTPCTRAIPFDNRFFYFGNPAYPNVFWHCELDNPAYISDVGYVKVGDSNSRIVDMAVQDGSLIVLKDGNQDASSIFVHTPTLDYDLGRVYPSSQSVISEGCVGGARSFRDDLVYMSARGVEGITSPTVTNSERSLKHRSTLIDSALAAESYPAYRRKNGTVITARCLATRCILRTAGARTAQTAALNTSGSIGRI